MKLTIKIQIIKKYDDDCGGTLTPFLTLQMQMLIRMSQGYNGVVGPLAS
jgi:hypothetical protein